MSRSRPPAAAVLAALALAAPALADARTRHDRPLAKKQFVTHAPGEARLALSAAAPQTDWGTAGCESAVLTVTVDGRYSQDVVLFAGAQRFAYDVALGPVARGRHRVEVWLNREKSAPGARGAKVWRLAPSQAARDDLAARYAPILYGRDLPEIPGRYQAPNHETKAFSGAKEGRHPLLVNVTSNNNLEQVTDPASSTGYRFFLTATDTLPADRAREAVMDANPWTYEVSAEEIAREGELEPVASPDTPAVSDQRNYVFAEVDKDTSYPAPPASGTWVGTALAVKLRGGDRLFTSHHDVPDWSIQRDDPAATTVELPPGATSADVEAIKAIAVPVARTSDPPAPAPADYAIGVRRLNRGFLLDDDFLPEPSFLQWSGDAVLTPQQPEAVIWEAP